MRKFIFCALVSLLFGCTSPNPSNQQTIDFRHFLRLFFSDEAFQISHVQFPVTLISLSGEEDDEPAITTSYIAEDQWRFLPGPDYYQCSVDCYDLVIYDNFDKVHRTTGERVLAFEGVNNGIHSALYFKWMNGRWTLVKFEQLDL